MENFILRFNTEKENLDDLYEVCRNLNEQGYQVIAIPDSCSLKKFNIEKLKDIKKEIEEIIEKKENI